MLADSLAPTTPLQRVESIDVLRGVVVLGILTINIVMFGLPVQYGMNPSLMETYEGFDVFAYVVAQVGFEGVQRTIFSMLFGAAVIIFTERLATDERQDSMTRLYYRRMFGLMLFGLVDMFLLLWFGDIIFLYGLVGLLLYFLRDRSIRFLLVSAGILMLFMTGLFAGIQAKMVYIVEPTLESAIETVEQGGTLEGQESTYYELFQEYLEVDEQISQDLEAKQAGYFSSYRSVLKLIYEFQLQQLPVYSFWDVLLMMLIGMALYRMRVFDASRSVRTYLSMIVLGFVVGISINVYEVQSTISQNYSLATLYQWTYNLGRLAMACGYIGTVMLVCKLGVLPGVRRRLAAVGRMALTNYLVQSIFCLVFFILLGFYGELRLHALYYVVFVVWALQLLYSPLWLARFRYGPAEYVLRRWTYGNAVSNRL